MWAIIKKEFKSYFLSPIGYIYIGIFLFITSLLFLVETFYVGSVEFRGCLQKKRKQEQINYC